MPTDRRLTLLKIVAATIVGLFAFDRLVLTPGIARWKAQGDRIAILRQNVQQGRLLLERETVLRDRFATMLREDLPAEVAAAENDLFRAIARWGREGRITFTGLNPQWRAFEQGYETLECRTTATGDQPGIGRFLYELEKDPLAVRLENIQISAQDAQGRKLTLNARFSAIRLPEPDAAAP